MSSEEEHLQEANGKLYTKELVLQDCNAYIKQVDLIKNLGNTICNAIIM